MCGIAGIYSFKDPTVERSLLERMNRELTHRGPDAEGYFLQGAVGLAMRRLKVIDLETGDQPIFNKDRSLCIVFNGEIYNYQALRKELEGKGYRFGTRSDTEVILHLYEEEREACLNRLVGMFAFAIYNVNDPSFFLARDRMGIKPLFYHHSSVGFTFASEIKALLEVPWIERRLNLQALSHFLSLNYLPAPWTPIEGVTQLLPGHWIKVTAAGIQMEEYWDIPLGESVDIPESEACRQIERLLHQSMERRLIADVPIGCYLSGGIDSSFLVGLMKEHCHERIKTFSVGFDDRSYDETPYAREAAKYFGTDHYEIKCEPRHVSELLPKIAWHADNLLADQAALPLYRVSELAKQHVTVCLSGDGGDEVFIGYPTFQADRYHPFYSRVPRLLRRSLVEATVSALPASADKMSFDYRARKFVEAAEFDTDKAHYWWRTVSTDQEKSRLFRPEILEQIPSLDSYPLYGEYLERAQGEDPINRRLYADQKVWLAGNNLYKVDTMSMAHGLEARVPFLDHELVEYMARLSPKLKFNGFKLKYLLKKIAREKIPERVLNRKKAGWHMPIAGWFQNALYPYAVENLLQHPSTTFRRLFRKEEVEYLLKEHRNSRYNHGFKIWGWLILNEWLKQYLDEDR